MELYHTTVSRVGYEQLKVALPRRRITFDEQSGTRQGGAASVTKLAFAPLLLVCTASFAVDSVDWIAALGGKAQRNAAGDIVAVNFRATWVNDVEMIDVAGLPKLERLDLSHTRISDEGMLRLKPASTIRELNLHYAEQVTDQGMAAIRNWRSLRRLNVRGTRIANGTLEINLWGDYRRSHRRYRGQNPHCDCERCKSGHGFSRRDVAAANGVFSIPDLHPGVYRVRAEAKGFNGQERQGVTLDANHAVNLDFQLSVGSSTTQVDVEASAPIINTETSITSFTAVQNNPER